MNKQKIINLGYGEIILNKDHPIYKDKKYPRIHSALAGLFEKLSNHINKGKPDVPYYYIEYQCLVSALKMILESMGTKISQRDLYDEYKPPEATEIRRGHMHNNFLNVGVHQGIVGLAIFIALFVVIIKDEYRIYKGVLKNKFLSSVVLGSLAAFVGFLVNGIFELNFRDSEVIMLIWFTIGVALASKKILIGRRFPQITAD